MATSIHINDSKTTTDDERTSAVRINTHFCDKRSLVLVCDAHAVPRAPICMKIDCHSWNPDGYATIKAADLPNGTYDLRTGGSRVLFVVDDSEITHVDTEGFDLLFDPRSVSSTQWIEWTRALVHDTEYYSFFEFERDALLAHMLSWVDPSTPEWDYITQHIKARNDAHDAMYAA